MLIAIDASRANIRHKTGPEWYSFYLIRYLAKLDKENEYILYSNKPLKGDLIDLTRECSQISSKEGKIEIDSKGYQKIKSPYNNFRAKILKWPFKYFWTQGRMSLEMVFNRPDVLFVPAHVLPIIHPKKSIVTIHDIGYECPVCSLLEGKMGPFNPRRKHFLDYFVKILTFGKYQVNTHDYLRWSTEYAVKHAKKIIVTSSYTKSDLNKKFKHLPDKISVIHNGYNTCLYNKEDDKEKVDRIKLKYGIEGEYLFYIGRIERKKNIPILIEAYAILKERLNNFNHKLVLVGDASFGYDEINYAIREFDLVDDVIMPGWVEEVDVPFLFRGADIFVFPSSYEGFGLPLLQAMAVGVPIVASDVTSIPEVVKDAALLCNPQYALSVSDSLAKVIGNKELRGSLVKKGFERVKEFSWEKTARETLKEINAFNN